MSWDLHGSLEGRPQVFKLFRTVKALTAAVARHERLFTQLGIKLGEHSKAVDALQKLAPVNLAAEITTLAGQVAAMRATHQRFQGRFDKYIALEGKPDSDEPDDPKWRALMTLQQPNGQRGE